MSASAERNLSAVGASTTGARSATSQSSHIVAGIPSVANAAAAAAFHPHLRLLNEMSTNAPPGHHTGATGTSALVNVNTPLSAALQSFLRPTLQLHQRQTFLPTAGPGAIPGTLTGSNQSASRDTTSGSGTGAVIKSPIGNTNVRDRLDFYSPHLTVGFGNSATGNHLSSQAAAAAAYLSAAGAQQQSASSILPTAAHQQTTVCAVGPNQQNAAATSFTPYHRLKVEDALSYLDQVKVQFGNKQHIYNDFLDIMKDFKSQAIDTPGVIQRVSQLFRGHPNLIVGFNTFLPPGYKIEVHGECGERVSICTPSGQSHVIAGEEIGPAVSGRPTSNQPAASITPTDSRGAAVANAMSNGPGLRQATGVQPLEFNHAINYVNKIKTRFQNQPDVYKQFLDILHTYQKEQRDLKEGVWPPGQRPLTEAEVYAMVARLFANEEDLLREFGQFLPDASSATAQMHAPLQAQLQHIQQHQPLLSSTSQPSGASLVTGQTAVPSSMMPAHVSPTPTASGLKQTASRLVSPPTAHSKTQVLQSSTAAVPVTSPRAHLQHGGESGKRLSRSPSPSTTLSPKKPRMTYPLMYEISPNEAARFGTLNEYQFFDKVRKALKEDEVYENFLRCLVLYNQELVSKTEVVQLVQPFLGKFPELLKWLRDFLGCNEQTGYVETVSPRAAGQERISSDLALEIDYASCKRFGVSYRALPKSYVQPKCSGRTPLCDEVLNDTWVSFPSWQSEDTFVSSKKTQYEEFVYRTEDERFELDIVIETNKSTIQVLENVQAQLARMPSEEAKRFRLDNSLGGLSQVLHQRAVRRIYGDKSGDIIDGLKRNPLVAVPLVLKRMKAKDEEWREAQKGFNRIWREQNEKYYWKSLDHQGLNFKQNDLKAIRSKALINQIETLYDERHEMVEEGITPLPAGPHMEIMYPEEKSVFYDVNDLLIYHVKRQSMQKDEKTKIKRILKVVLPDLFGLDAVELSDDEDGGDDDTDDRGSNNGDGDGYTRQQRTSQAKSAIKMEVDDATIPGKAAAQISNCAGKRLFMRRSEKYGKSSCGYSLMFFPNPWYVFLRLHQLLCERLAKLHGHANQLINEQRSTTDDNDDVSAAEALRCRPKAPCSPTEYYPMLVQLIKNVLDGQIDSIQFEDNLRDMFTINAYLSFTMDRMVQTMVKQLQSLVNEDLCVRSMALFEKWSAAGGAGGYAYDSVNRRDNEDAYQREAEQLMLDQNCFKSYFFHEDCRVTFELLNTDSESDESPDTIEKSNRWTSYVQDYIESISGTVGIGAVPEQFLEALAAKPVFLNRTIRRMRKFYRVSDTKKPSSDDATPKDDFLDNEQASTSDIEKKSGQRDSYRERIRALRGVYVNENLQARCNLTGRFRYVAGSEDLIYRFGSIQRARNCRLKVTETKNRRFGSLHERWGLANVSMDQARITGDWFMGRADNMQLASVWMQRIQETCPMRPPIFYINKYLVDKSQNPATFGLSQPNAQSSPAIGVTAPSTGSTTSR